VAVASGARGRNVAKYRTQQPARLRARWHLRSRRTAYWAVSSQTRHCEQLSVVSGPFGIETKMGTSKPKASGPFRRVAARSKWTTKTRD
jgi:hypothetical protein